MPQHTSSELIRGRISGKASKAVKQGFLVFAFVTVLTIAALYGISPQWFAQTFLDLPSIPLAAGPVRGVARASGSKPCPAASYADSPGPRRARSDSFHACGGRGNIAIGSA